jgi:hypothetical protein
MDNLNLPAKPKRGGARPGAGSPPYEPTPSDRATVKNLVVCGYTHEQIARCIGSYGISEKTLRKHFRRELDISKAEVDAFATSNLVNMIRDRNLGAICFYLKCRAGWQEITAQRFVDEKGKDRPFLLTDADRLVADADEEDSGR